MNKSYGTHGGVCFTTIDSTPESLRKRAKQLEKSAKAEKRAARKAAARRRIAIDALTRVASDPKRGYAAVEAAKELLQLDDAR